MFFFKKKFTGRIHFFKKNMSQMTSFRTCFFLKKKKLVFIFFAAFWSPPPGSTAPAIPSHPCSASFLLERNLKKIGTPLFCHQILLGQPPHFDPGVVSPLLIGGRSRIVAKVLQKHTSSYRGFGRAPLNQVRLD